ncbi:MAG: hypothetical protein LBI27_09050 [Clostridiales bacterium]|nr:hypothetical protein [Clostridiales bacterium]
MKKKITSIVLVFFLLTFAACNKRVHDEVIIETAIESPESEQEPTLEPTPEPTPDPRYYNRLIRTGEFFTVEQMEEIKAQAISWRWTIAGATSFAEIIALEPSDGSGEQVYIAIDRHSETYLFERIEVQTPNDAEARIEAALGGGGSGEINLVYRFTAENEEWFEIFYAFTFSFRGFGYDGHSEYDGAWENLTYVTPSLIEYVIENPYQYIYWRSTPDPRYYNESNLRTIPGNKFL